MVTRKLTTSGDSICLRLDKTSKEILGITSKDDYVEITFFPKKIVIKKAKEKVNK
jgi:hypothetical protein